MSMTDEDKVYVLERFLRMWRVLLALTLLQLAQGFLILLLIMDVVP